MSKEEQKFYEELQNIFVGAKVEGQGGFINLMKIKSRYYNAIKDKLDKDVDDALKEHPSFREELFDKLYSFFKRYFTQNGSICFNDTAFHNDVYEKVYTSENDVVLFWKTQMLYYVKTDNLYQNMPIEFDGLKFYFDASNLENKKANEKKSLTFCLKDVNDVIHFEVTRSGKTKINDIQKGLKRKNVSIDEKQLERAFKLFERQSEVDYFINKNAASFLKEQFKLWSYQYFWENAPRWDSTRVNQLQILKDIAFKIIDFIAQFEDELVKIWNKPKFAKNAHYVISLKTLKSIMNKSDYEKHLRLATEQVSQSDEYQEDIKNTIREVYRDNVAGIFVKSIDFNKNNISVSYKKRNKQKNGYNDWKNDDDSRPREISYESIYIDTKFFEKKIESELLDKICISGDLDDLLDGWLIKSESRQAIHSISKKHKNQVDLIYIDPPFNTQRSGFLYKDGYLDSSWLSLINDKISDSLTLLKEGANFCLHLDENADYYGRLLLESNGLLFQRELIWDVTAVAYSPNKKTWIRSHDVILHACNRSDPLIFNPIEVEKNKWDVKKMGSILGGKKEDDIITTKYTHFNRNENIQDFNTQKTESLLARIIKVLSDKNGIVFDYFAGTGTTLAAAHKLGRKWIGVELAEYFETITLPRIKKVVWGDLYGISKDVNWQGGGFFKYYELEQYEESLNRCKYKDGDIINHTDKSTYEQYVFLPDEKMLSAIELDYKNDKIKVDLGKLYDGIDIAETLSNLKGKRIKFIKKNKVVFVDDSEIDIVNIDYQSIKPLIWWER